MSSLPGRATPVANANRSPTTSYYAWFLTIDAFITSVGPSAPTPDTRTIVAGAGLTGGGDLSTDRTLAVGAGTGIQVNADSVEVEYGTTAGTAAQGNDARIVGAAQTSSLGSAAYASTSAFDASGTASGAVAAHVAASDPHPQYLTAAEGSAAFQPLDSDLTAFAAKTAPTGAVVGTTDAQTLTNKTLTAPAISSPTGIVKADVGLGNVDNTSDATKNAATVTLTNKTLTTPVINSPTGIVKADVGLGNVDNTSDATKNAATATLTNKNLASGTNTFPTFNQNTTGSAASLTTARTIDGVAFDGTANVTVIAPGAHAATSKATPVDADEIPLVDSAASNVLKKLTWANLKATLKTYLDTLYLGVGTGKQIIGGNSGSVLVPAGGTIYVGYVGSFTETDIYVPLPANCSGTISNLTIVSAGSPGGVGEKYTGTLRNTLADTTLTCDIVSGLNTGSDNTHSVAFAAGNRFALKVTASGGASSTNILWSAKLTFD